MKITFSDFEKKFDYYLKKSEEAPIQITLEDGKSVVLLSLAHYQLLKSLVEN